MRKQTVAGALCAAGMLMCGQAAAAAGPTRSGSLSTAPVLSTAADARFAAIHRAEWAWRKKEQLADDDAEPGQVASDFERVDAATQAARLAYWQGVLRRLDGIDAATLSATEKINFQVYRAQIAAFAEALRFREYEQPVNADSAFWTDVSYGARQPLASAADYRNYLVRLQHLPRYFDEQIANMRAGLARGFTPPRVTLAGRDSALASVVEAAPEDTVFYTPFKNMPASIPAAEQAALRAQAVAAIWEEVQPAYAAVLTFMRAQYVPGARSTCPARARRWPRPACRTGRPITSRRSSSSRRRH